MVPLFFPVSKRGALLRRSHAPVRHNGRQPRPGLLSCPSFGTGFRREAQEGFSARLLTSASTIPDSLCRTTGLLVSVSAAAVERSTARTYGQGWCILSGATDSYSLLGGSPALRTGAWQARESQLSSATESGMRDCLYRARNSSCRSGGVFLRTA